MQETIDKIAKFLDEKKAEDIEVFDLSNKDYIAKFVIIANAQSNKHTLALLYYIRKEIKEFGLKVYATDESDDWVVVDVGDILIHIMTPQYRAKYSLEEFLTDLKVGD